MEWEKYKAQPHDHWWANFVRAARIRTEQIRAQDGPDAKITWLVYKQGYNDRGAQEKMNLLGFIDSVRDEVQPQPRLLPQRRRSHQLSEQRPAARPDEDRRLRILRPFEQACFMFDYSSNIDSASKSFLHESQLKESIAGFSRGARRSGAGAATPARGCRKMAGRDRHEDVGRDRQNPVHE